jgi:hypothetical protein
MTAAAASSMKLPIAFDLAVRVGLGQSELAHDQIVAWGPCDTGGRDDARSLSLRPA